MSLHDSELIWDICTSASMIVLAWGFMGFSVVISYLFVIIGLFNIVNGINPDNLSNYHRY